MKLDKTPVPAKEAAIASVRRLKNRDTQAMADVYDAYGRMIFAVILRLVRDRGIAEDLTQETFLRVWNHAAIFDETRGGLDAWITTVARNRAVDYLRLKSWRVECPAVASYGNCRAVAPAAGDNQDDHPRGDEDDARAAQPGGCRCHLSGQQVFPIRILGCAVCYLDPA
jgi:DNA-directed RNA polymerase specialized sigma24 family protein